ncbi:Uncharacterized protein OBRU01_20684 [Operophtera brumata]|uniref:Fatty acid synthase n=1 Tax=Operophtera brumata TaxID=104452 RepID=A0A0L7KUV1_OPEBR|nr:Uncharacterized protein OBRU01_20684 [Operophtera brumata]
MNTGKVLYPFSAALVAAWDTLAMTLGERKKDVSVQFRDVHLYSQPIMHEQRQLKLSVSLHRGNGQFHILDEFSKVASGFISTFSTNGPEISNEASNQSNQQLKIRSEEIYQHLSSRGYGYRHVFKSIHSVNENMTEAELVWNENWNILIDSMLQLNVLKHSHLGIVQPSKIRELSIDVDKHYKSFYELTDGTRVIKAKVDPIFDNTSCGGIVLRNIKFQNMVIGTPGKLALELAVASTPDNVVVNEKIMEHNMLFNKSMERKSLALKVRRIGELNTLHWEEAAYKSAAGLKIKVQYAGVNVADINKAAGVIPFADDENYFEVVVASAEVLHTGQHTDEHVERAQSVKHVELAKPVKHMERARLVKHVEIARPVKHVERAQLVKHVEYAQPVKHVDSAKPFKHVERATPYSPSARQPG